MMLRGLPRQRAGFTLLELLVSGLLLGLLATMLATAWPVFFRAASEVAMRGQLAQEADLALNRIAQDLAGIGGAAGDRRCLVEVARREVDDDGDPTAEVYLDLRFGTAWAAGGLPPPSAGDPVVSYRIDPDDGTIGRRPSWNAAFVPSEFEPVARHVAELSVAELQAPATDPWIEVELVLRHPVRTLVGRRHVADLERSYTLIACVPSGAAP